MDRWAWSTASWCVFKLLEGGSSWRPCGALCQEVRLLIILSPSVDYICLKFFYPTFIIELIHLYAFPYFVSHPSQCYELSHA